MSESINLDVLPPDPLLGLMTSFRKDARVGKVDLGVGVYRDAEGQTPIMKAVKRAEQELLISERTKVYEGPSGNRDFCAAVERLILGHKLSVFESRVASLATPGGCGAIYLALQLLKRANPKARVWVSDPTWPNHIGVSRSLELELKTYNYARGMMPSVQFETTLSDLKKVSSGDIIVIQGPCHNPTGVDLTRDQWACLADLLNERGGIPLIDIAYHGLGNGLEADIAGVLSALERLETACISYSCSKNFGLYRERTGCLLTLSPSQSSCSAMTSHLNDIARSCYSMPPAHGAAIVQTILSTIELRAEWEVELKQMRERITSLRSALATALVKVTGNKDFAAIALQKGMFSQLPLSGDQASRLIQEHAIYVPASGRLNIAGLNAASLEQTADRLGQALQRGN